jgi:hypothetical protein
MVQLLNIVCTAAGGRYENTIENIPAATTAIWTRSQ